MTETPFCLSLHICDVAYSDGTTGKWNILGSYDRVQPKEFPTSFPIAVYFAITDGRGTMPMKFVVVDARSELDDPEQPVEPVGQLEGELTLGNPLEVVQGAVVIHCTFENPGAYNCELWVDDKRLMARHLLVAGPTDGSDA